MASEHGGVLTDENWARFDMKVEQYRNTNGPLMPILNEAQKIFGCIPLKVQQRISDGLGVPLAEVYGVITFYSHFSLEPRGRHVIGLCLGTACYVKNAQRILEELEKEAGTKAGKTSDDGRFTIEATRCIGACGLAPVLTVNKDVYGRVTVDQIAAIIAKYH